MIVFKIRVFSLLSGMLLIYLFLIIEMYQMKNDKHYES